MILAGELHRNGHEVMLTREWDEDPRQRKRARLSNRWGADVFVSCHYNGAISPQANGTEVLYWHSSERGKALAQEIQTRLLLALRLRDRGIKPREPGSRGATVLRATHCPAVIIEPAFITNFEEEALVASLSFQAEVALAVARAVHAGRW